MGNSFFNHIATVADGVIVSGLYMTGYSNIASSVVSMFDNNGIVKWGQKIKDGVTHIGTVGDRIFTNIMKNDSNDTLISMINTDGELINSVDISGRCSGMVKIHDGYIYDICNDNGMGSISCTDLTGKIIWTSYVGGFYCGSEFTDFAISRDGYIYIVGSKNYEHSDKPMIGKWDLYGREVWIKYIDNVDSSFNSVSIDNDGYIYASSYDTLISKWDGDGELVWKMNIHGRYTMKCIAVDNIGYIYGTGRKDANSYLFKWNKNGKLVWEKMLENGTEFINIITQIVTNGEDVFTIGLEVSKNNNTRGVLSKWDKNACLKWNEHLG